MGIGMDKLELNKEDDAVDTEASTPAYVHKFTKWKLEPTLEDLKVDLQNSSSSLANHRTNLSRWYTLLKGKAIPVPVGTNASNSGSKIEPRLINKQAEWRIPSLTEPFMSTPEMFKLDPISHEDRKRALQNELIINNQFSTQIGKVRLMDSYIRTLVTKGTAILRTGWEFVEEETTDLKPIFTYTAGDEAVMEELMPYMEMMQREPDTFNQLDDSLKETVRVTSQLNTPMIANQTDQLEVKVKKTLVNRPTVDVCNSANVYIDPVCEGDMDKAQFVIHAFEASLSDLRKDSRYKNLDHIKGMNTSTEYQTDSATSSFNFKDEARKKVTVLEYWGYRDVDGNGLVRPIVATWIGNVLIRLEANPYPDQKIPFVVVSYIPQERSVYGIPDAELLEDNQKILGAVTRGVVDLLGKSANSQTGVARGMLDATNRVRFRNGSDYEYNPNYNPASHMYMHKFPEVPQSALWLINMMNTDAEAISGVKAFSSQGITGSGLGDTAAGVRSAMDAASKRELNILRRVSDGLIQVARKIISMNSEFLSEEEVIRITNREFVTVRRDDLAGNFDIRMSISTAEADEAKAKELGFMMQTMGNNMDGEMSKIILGEIARLRNMPDLAYKIETFEPQPDPNQEQMVQLEMMKLQAEIEYYKAQAAESMAKATLQGAKVPVEQARAENIQGDADLKSQKFVDQANGTATQTAAEKQQRDIEGSLAKERIKSDTILDAKHIDRINADEQFKNQHNSDVLKLHAQNSFGSGQK